MAKAHTFQHIVDKQMAKYDERYAEFGDDCRALGWPREEDNAKRFETMLGLVRWVRHNDTTSILDFGCGLGHFLGWLLKRGITYDNTTYTGLDVNQRFVNACYEKHPDLTFLHLDILNDEDFGNLPAFDYIVCNGVFTEKLDTPQVHQWFYFASVISRLWHRTRHGLAFNVMSPVVDYERPDLFHVKFDIMAQFVRKELGCRNFVFRHDYGLWEYTTYMYKEV